MAKRNSAKDIDSISDLERLNEIVIDKRNSKRSSEKKNRRNRHYEKLFIKLALSQGPKDLKKVK